MAQLAEVVPGLLAGHRIIGRDGREPQFADRRVDEHGREAEIREPLVVLVRRVRLGVLAADEDDARDLLLDRAARRSRLR